MRQNTREINYRNKLNGPVKSNKLQDYLIFNCLVRIINFFVKK